MADKFKHDETAVGVANTAVGVLFVGWLLEVSASDPEMSAVTWILFLAVAGFMVVFIIGAVLGRSRLLLWSYLVLATAYGVGFFFHLAQAVVNWGWSQLTVGEVGSAVVAGGVMLALIALAVNESR